MYFIAGKADGHIEEKNGNKYLVFDSTGKNKEALKKYTELWDGIKNLIETIDNKLSEYGKAFTKIKFNSADNLLLSRALKLYNLTVVVKSVFKDGKYYPQVFLEEIFKDIGYKFKPYACKRCHDLSMMVYDLDFTILNIKGVDYRCFVCNMSKNTAIKLLNNSQLDDKNI